MSDLKPCPVCKGQSGGIGSDGVENDCMACFTRDVQAASPRVEACIASCLARYHGESKAAQARYFEEVHQHLAPLARSLEIELAEAKAELARRPQPEATAPAQDLSAAIPDEEIIRRFEQHIDIGPNCFTLKDGECAYWIKNTEVVKFARALASSANALSEGSRVDAERYRFLRNISRVAEMPTVPIVVMMDDAGDVVPDDVDAHGIRDGKYLDAAIDAAIIQSKNGGGHD